MDPSCPTGGRGQHATDAPGTPDPMTALALRAQSGDQGALHELLAQLRPEALRRCRRILTFEPDAEDACQEALMAVVKGLPSFSGRSRFSTWAYTVVSRSAFATYRRMRDEAARHTSEEVDVADPHRVSVLAGARVDLTEAIDALSRSKPLLAQAVIMRDVAGLDYDEIARELGVALGTVKSRIANGRGFLREALAGHR